MIAGLELLPARPGDGGRGEPVMKISKVGLALVRYYEIGC